MSYVYELADDNESASQRIAEALKEARDADTPDRQIKSLSSAMHLLIDPSLPNNVLDNFLTEMLEFAELDDARIICLVIDFLLKACAKDFSICNLAIKRFNFFLLPNDSIPRYTMVIKRVVVASTSLYPIVMEFVINEKNDKAEDCWNEFNFLKSRICMLVDDRHEGIRTVTVKFLEALILCQSPKPKELTSECSWFHEANTRFTKISLADLPRNHRFLSYHKAQLEAEENFSALIKQTTVTEITSQNLLAVIESLCMITRCRPQWENALQRVFDVIKALHSNVPPMLSKGQVKFLRKSFKYNLLRFLKLPASVPLQPKIKTMLTDYLGASSGEVMRSIPSELIQKPAAQRPAPSAMEPAPKRPRIQNPVLFDDEDDDDEPGSSTQAETKITKDNNQQATDITAQFIFERLDKPTTLSIVKLALLTLPQEIPAAFASSYTPIANAGSHQHRQALAELLAVQMTQKGFGPGYEWLVQKKKEEYAEREKNRSEGVVIAKTPHHEPVGSRDLTQAVKQQVAENERNLQATTQKAKKAFNLIEETKEITDAEAAEMFDAAFDSVLHAERRVVAGGARRVYQQLVVRLSTRFWEDCSPFEDKLIEFVLADHKRRNDLALLWLCELYAQYQGYSNCALRIKEMLAEGEGDTQAQRLERYDVAMCKMLDAMLKRKMEKETLFYKVLLETPLLTTNAIERLKLVCLAKENEHGMAMLRELIMTRNRQRPQLLQFLFGLCFDRAELRTSCLEVVKELCNLPFIRSSLSDQARMQINDCLEKVPPKYMQNVDAPEETWTEEMYKNSLAVYTTLMPTDPALLLPLAAVYAQGSNIFKRIVLRAIEPVFRHMTQDMVVSLINECPNGAETLVARLVVLLSDRAIPSPELIQKLKKLHDDRKMDIRALLPIIGGLEKDEVHRLIPMFVFRMEYQKSVNMLFRKLYTVRNPQTGELIFDPVDIITEYHRIEPKDDNEAVLLINNLEFLFDPMFLKPDTASQAIEAIFKWEQVPFLFLHSLYTLYHKFKTFESFVANLFSKVTERKIWQQSDRCKSAFFKCVKELKTKAYAAVLTTLDFEEYEEMKQAMGEDIVAELKVFYNTMGSTQQKNMDEKIKEELYDKERENRERDRRLRREERKEKEKEEKREKDRLSTMIQQYNQHNQHDLYTSVKSHCLYDSLIN